MQKDNATQTLIKLTEALKIPVTRKTLTEELERHPDYESLAAFSDVLDRIKVPNAAYRLTFEQLSDLPAPYIAHLSRKEFGVILQFDSSGVIVTNERWSGKKFTTENFQKIYSGTVLLAEADEQSGEADYAAKLKRQKIEQLRQPVVFGGALLLLVTYLLFQTSFIQTLTLSVALLTVFKTAGLITSVLLLIQSIDANNPLVQKLCGDDNKNCNAILSSKAAKVVDGLSWSEVGLFYFAGTWLVLLLGGRSQGLMGTLVVLNLLALPYTFYSIYYQWRVAKQWCVFCCTVQALLWLEFFALLPYLKGAWLWPTTAEWLNLATGMAAPVLLWMLAKPYLMQSKELKPLKADLRKFKYNTDLFNTSLQNELHYALPAAKDSLIIGNPEAEKVVTMVANPYCQPCAKAHKALEWLNHRDDVKLQVIFSTRNDEDKKAIVAAHLLAMQSAGDSVTVGKAMHDWYEQKQKNYDEWAKQYPAQKIDNAAALQTQREWCKLAEITGTPTIFINGRRLPKAYRTEDLKYFI